MAWLKPAAIACPSAELSSAVRQSAHCALTVETGPTQKRATRRTEARRNGVLVDIVDMASVFHLKEPHSVGCNQEEQHRPGREQGDDDRQGQAQSLLPQVHERPGD